MEINIIAAVADNGAIGRENRLLWHIKEDMKYFRRTTIGYPVIMGYRTWLSIGRPLPGRKNIVITREPFDAPDGVVQASDMKDAVLKAGEPISAAGPEKAAPDKCFIIGGAKTYVQALNMADALFITHIHACVPDADAFFPDIDPNRWMKVSESDKETDPENGVVYTFAVYRRKS